MGDVSRETLPAPDPAVAALICPAERLGLLERYAGLLATDGVTRGLIGPRETPRLWDRHLVNCALVAPSIPEDASVVDLGSGAGLPGLVLAIVRPDLVVTLVEPMARRVEFLTEAVELLGLDGVEVVRARAETWTGAPAFDVVTARAVAPLKTLLVWGWPLVARGGQLLAMKGSSAPEEVAAASTELRRRGARADVVRHSVRGSSETTLVRVVHDPDAAIGWSASGARRRRRGRA